jgi:transposase
MIFCCVVQVRYRYRIYPAPRQQQALARTFGCARVVYNDCLRLRDACHAAGETISDTEVQRRVVTLAKRTPERAWLGDVASAHDRDVNAARNVLALGRRESLNACGGQVRPAALLAPASETGTHRSAA